MRVLYFHQHFSSPSGSTGIRSYAMSRSLVDRGHEVTLVCGNYLSAKTGLTGPFFNGQRRGMVNGIDVLELELSYANSDGFIRRTLTFLKYSVKGIKLAFTEEYDLIFATSTPLTAGIPGIIMRWLKNKPFIFEVRDLWPELPKAMGVITNPIILSLMSVLEWMSYHSANRIIALSPGIAEGIERRGVARDNICMIPNGCDLDIFNNAVEAWRPKEIGKSDLLVLYAGTHGLANGLDSVLDAARELKSRKNHRVKFLLVGEGKLKKSLMDRAILEDLNNVIFHIPVDKKKLAGLMASTDIGLQILANVPVFYYGTSPNKFFDYISAGLPVLNNYPGWLSELINENNCGFSVSPEDPVAFADILEKAAADPSVLRDRGSNAKVLAIEKFDRNMLASRWVDQLEAVYRNGIEK